MERRTVWKRDSRPRPPTTTAALLPAIVQLRHQPSTRVGPNPTREFEEEWRASQAGCLAHAAFPLPSSPFSLLLPSSLVPINIPLTPSSYSPLARYLAFLLFHRQSCSYSPTSLWSVSNLSHPLSLSLSLSFTPTSSAPFSPFFVISPPSLTPISLHPFITTPRVPTAAPSTSNDDDDEDSGTALFLSRAPNKHEFEELAYRRNYEGKHFLEMPRSSTRVG